MSAIALLDQIENVSVEELRAELSRINERDIMLRALLRAKLRAAAERREDKLTAEADVGAGGVADHERVYGSE